MARVLNSDPNDDAAELAKAKARIAELEAQIAAHNAERMVPTKTQHVEKEPGPRFNLTGSND